VGIEVCAPELVTDKPAAMMARATTSSKELMFE
jgi:hypothetical protein